MTGTMILQSTAPRLDLSTDSPHFVLSACLFGCGRPPKRGSVFCGPCASAWWEELRIVGRSKEPIPDLETLHARVLAARAERATQRKRTPRVQIAPYAKLPRRLVLDRRFSGSPTGLRVYSALAGMGADARFVPYNTRHLAEDLGYSVTTVRRAIRLLIDRKYLTVSHEWGVTLIQCTPEQ